MVYQAHDFNRGRLDAPRPGAVQTSLSLPRRGKEGEVEERFDEESPFTAATTPAADSGRTSDSARPYRCHHPSGVCNNVPTVN